MKVVIDKESVSIVFEDSEEKNKFTESKYFQEFLKTLNAFGLGDKAKEKIDGFDWEKWRKQHPEIWNPITYPIPNQIQDPPIDVSPRINDPVRFPTHTEDDPNRYKYYTVTMGGADATPKFDGADATPRYGKATVDWPSRYPCDVDSEFLKKKDGKKRSRK